MSSYEFEKEGKRPRRKERDYLKKHKNRIYDVEEDLYDVIDEEEEEYFQYYDEYA